MAASDGFAGAAGEAEREQAVAALRTHFAQGHLTRAELDTRLETALTAATRAEVAHALRDLPAQPEDAPGDEGRADRRGEGAMPHAKAFGIGAATATAGAAGALFGLRAAEREEAGEGSGARPAVTSSARAERRDKPVRKNHLALTKEEKRRFVQALLEVKRKGIYDELVQIHIAINGGDFLAKEGGARVAHISPGFLPWHRQYLLELENALREVDDSVALPYWDWTYDQSPDSPLWSPDFMGGNGRPGDRMVMDGPFAHANGWVIRTSALPVGQPALNGHYTVDDRPYLTRDIGAKTDRLPTAKELADTLALPVYDCPPYNHESGSEPPYRSFRNHLEGYTRFPWEPDTGKLHSRGHRWTGGHMGYIASPNDPVFFLHHCFVDKCWAMWQERHPDVPHYLPEAETEEVGGLHTSLLPWHTMSAADLIDHTRYYTYE